MVELACASIHRIICTIRLSSQVYRLSANGTLSVFAGSGNFRFREWARDLRFSFANPGALSADQAGNIYVWDSGNHLIRKIDQSENVTTIAGNGSSANVDGLGTAATFGYVGAMQADNSGNIFLACGSCIRKIDAATNVTTISREFLAKLA